MVVAQPEEAPGHLLSCATQQANDMQAESVQAAAPCSRTRSSAHLAARQADAIQRHQVRMAQRVQPLRLSNEGALAGQVPPNLHLLRQIRCSKVQYGKSII